MGSGFFLGGAVLAQLRLCGGRRRIAGHGLPEPGEGVANHVGLAGVEPGTYRIMDEASRSFDKWMVVIRVLLCIDGDNVGFDEAVAALRDPVGHVGGAIPGRDPAIILYKRIYVVPRDQL